MIFLSLALVLRFEMVSKPMTAAEVAVIKVLRLIRQVVVIFKTFDEFHGS